MSYVPREAEKLVRQYLEIFPIVGIGGPRQSGKSTLIRNLLKETHQYVTFDDFRIRQQFADDPIRFMKTWNDQVIYDEAQFVPELFPMLKMLVDEDRQRYGRFVVTGSGQFMLNRSISESLAGRIGLINLLPFQYSEVPESSRLASIYSGSYPEIVLRDYSHSHEWYQAYLETYLQKDLRQILNIGDLSAFTSFLRTLAAQTGQIISLSEISRNIGVAVSTVSRWLSILESSFIVFRLQPYYKNLGKRLIKSPKIYFFDTGLVSLLTGIETRQEWEKGLLYGPIFENYIVSELYKKIYHENLRVNLFYLRTSHGDEIDLILENGSAMEAIEIKATMTSRPDHLKTMKKYLGILSTGSLVYLGDSFPEADGLQIINYQDFLSGYSPAGVR
jgi:predicted AAA+ superfamily ATPase